MAAKAGGGENAGKSGDQKYSNETERITALIRAAAEKGPEQLRGPVDKTAPFLAMAYVGVSTALPYIIAAYTKASEAFSKLPEDIAYAVTGMFLCFFGGMYPVTIAAYEAIRMTGGQQFWDSCTLLVREARKVESASKKDDELDDDNDGVADVNQISGGDLLLRKTQLFLKVADPDLINSALAGLYKCWVGVMATLKIRFAKTIALGAAIGDILQKPAMRYVCPALEGVTPDEYAKWIPQVIGYICKAIAISIAWFVQRIISAVHSGIRGGQMFARGVILFGNKRGYCKIDMDNSNMDEALGWAVAAVGILFQLWLGLSLPFLLRLPLMPIEILEYYLMWSVSD